ncbi:MAG: hypothetical protein AABW59_01980 [archaeon]
MKKHFPSSKKFSAPKKQENNLFSKVGDFYGELKKKFSFLKWVDPFTYVDLFVMPQVKKVTDSEAVEFIVNVFFAFLFAWGLYAALGMAFGTSTPLVIVYSASMEDTLFRGDVMALKKADISSNFGPIVELDEKIARVPSDIYVTPSYVNGSLSSLKFLNGQVVSPDEKASIVVYTAYPSGLPIIHRAIALVKAKDGYFILTKGDNGATNPTFDQDCGNIIGTGSQKPCISYYATPVNELSGIAFFNVPKVGCVKLWLVDDLISIVASGALPRDFRGYC